MDTQIDRPSRFLKWAHDIFGDIALDHQERTNRFVEEAIELAHAMGIEAATVSAITERVYSRPAGAAPQEMGQALATLELLAKATGMDADMLATREFHRVQSIPREEWARRHAAKVALGIAR